MNKEYKELYRDLLEAIQTIKQDIYDSKLDFPEVDLVYEIIDRNINEVLKHEEVLL